MATFLTSGVLKENILTVTASVTSLSLTPASPSIIHVIGTTTQTIVLPSALTLENGIHYILVNDSTGTVTVEDATSSLIATLGSGIFNALYLSNNSTVAGVWTQASIQAIAATVAQNSLDIATLQALVSTLPLEQSFIVGVGGQSIFDLTAFTIDASNSVFDVDYFIDGRWQQQSVIGDFSDGAVRKNSTTEVETVEVIPEGKEFVVVKRTMSGGIPLVDLTGITVDLGFVTPKTVGTLLRPASALIVKDSVTTDIWKIQVTSGAIQLTKIN